MANFDPQFRYGDQGVYYEHDGCRYDSHFPHTWARCHGSGGPKRCPNCCAYGSIHGVFVHYCSNCARFHGDRHSIELPKHITDERVLWEKVPYMTGVSFDQIGDSAFGDSCGDEIFEEDHLEHIDYDENHTDDDDEDIADDEDVAMDVSDSDSADDDQQTASV